MNHTQTPEFEDEVSGEVSGEVPSEACNENSDAVPLARSPHMDCSAVILSGGLNSRMAGRNKAFLEVGGESILGRLLAGLRPHFAEILLVTRQPHLYAGFPVRVIEDIYPDRSSLTGIHAALVKARSAYIFVVPCDTPFLEPAVVRLLLGALEPRYDVVVPMLEDHYEPLCAIYSKRCVPLIEAMLERGDYKIIDLYERMRVKVLSAERIRAADPELRSFFNVNTPAALSASQKLNRDGSPS
jgi:molybdopterin-guanine dinucleotide biosynthesis protein A